MAIKKITDVAFDWDFISSATLGGRFHTGRGEVEISVGLPIEPNSVGKLLREMLRSTIKIAGKDVGTSNLTPVELAAYQVAELYQSEDPVWSDVATPYLQSLFDFFKNGTVNLTDNLNYLKKLKDMKFYFAVFIDNAGKRAVGCRRALNVKGLAGKVKWLLFLDGDTLTTVGNEVIILEECFDFVILEEGVFIARPNQFTACAVDSKELRTHMVLALPTLAQAVPCVKWNALSDYISKHTLAAKYVASIRARPDLSSVTAEKIKNFSALHKVELHEDGKQLYPKQKHEIDFLKILDDRLYATAWDDSKPISYDAGNRRQRGAASVKTLKPKAAVKKRVKKKAATPST